MADLQSTIRVQRLCPLPSEKAKNSFCYVHDSLAQCIMTMKPIPIKCLVCQESKQWTAYSKFDWKAASVSWTQQYSFCRFVTVLGFSVTAVRNKLLDCYWITNAFTYRQSAMSWSMTVIVNWANSSVGKFAFWQTLIFSMLFCYVVLMHKQNYTH